MTNFLKLVLVLLPFLWIQEAKSQKKKVLIIGIDGTVNTTLTQTWAPNIYALMNDGHSYVNTDVQVNVPTVSGNGWSAILMGVGVTKHLNTSNAFPGNQASIYPSLFNAIKQSFPNYRTGSITSWTPINKNIVNTNDVTFKVGDNSSPDYLEDEAMTVATIAELQNQDPDVLFVHLDDVDAAGHGSGFSPLNPNYTAAVTLADSRVKRMLDALKARTTYANEDWLIAITTDHGGTYTPATGQTSGPGSGSHGGSSYVERNSFIILNNKSITSSAYSSSNTISHTENTITYPGTKTNADDVSMYGQLPEESTNNKINFSSEDFTIELRVRMLNATGDNYPPIISNKNWNAGANAGFALAWHSGALRFNYVSGTGTTRNDIVSTIPLNDQKWHYLSIVVNQTSKKVFMYDNGVLNTIGTFTSGTPTLTGLPVCIAADGDGNYSFTPFNGNISHVRIYKAALIDDVIKANWNNDNLTSANVPAWASLVFYNKCNTLLGSTLTGDVVPDGATTNIAIRTNSYTAPTSTTAITAGLLVKSTSTTTPHIENTITYPGTKTSAGDVSMYGQLPLASTNEKINFSSDNFTIELRVRMLNATADNYPPIITNKNWNSGANPGFALAWHSSALRFNYVSGTGTTRNDIVSTIPLDDQRWHYVTVAVNQVTKKVFFYDNGILNTVGSFTSGTPTLTGLPVCIGGDADGNYNFTPFSGNITHVRIYKGVLSEKSVKLNWDNDNLTAANTTAWDSLMFYNKCNTLTGTTLSGNNVKDGAATDIAIKTNSFVAPTALTEISASLYSEGHPPFNYSVAPSVLKFLGVPIPSSYDGVALVDFQSVVLPVDLISFDAIAKTNSVALNWTVENEKNLNRYEIQRSANLYGFVTIGTVEAAAFKTYNINDNNPLSGVSYYRLKMIDIDGTVKYSAIKTVRFEKSAVQKSLSIINPVMGNQIKLLLFGYEIGNYDYKIVSATGASIQHGKILYDGASYNSINISSGLSKGSYTIYINNGTEATHARLVRL